MTDLTAKQRDILCLILVHLAAFGRPPTVRYLRGALRIGINAVYDRLRLVANKGYLPQVQARGRARRALARQLVPFGCRLDHSTGRRVLYFTADAAGERLHEAFDAKGAA